MTVPRWEVLILAMMASGIFLVTAARGQEAGTAPAAPAGGAAAAEQESDEAEEATGPERNELPMAADTPLPSVPELLSGERRDWVILTDGRLLIVEPVFPQPSTLEKIQQERDAIQEDRRRRFSAEGRARLTELNSLNIFLPGEGEAASEEFQIPVTQVQEILHHEDLMLRQAAALIDAGKTREAFELVIVVARHNPQWPGLVALRNRLAVADAVRFVAEGQLEQGLALVETLYDQDPVPTETRALMDQLADGLIGKALEAGDGRHTRFALRRIREVQGDHPAVARWTNQITAHAAKLRDEAVQAESAEEFALAAEKVTQAADFWPTLSGLKAIHARISERYQILRVGVTELAPEVPGALPSAAEQRAASLLHADLFELSQFTSLPSYRSLYMEHWEPTDLGRRARFQLRSQLPNWTTRPAMSASEIIGLLSARIRPGDPAYDARFADLVGALRLLGPEEFEVEFLRIPRQTEAILAFGRAGATRRTEAARQAFSLFVETTRSENKVTYRRSAEGKAPAARVLAEVVEVAYPTYESAIQALDRGDVRMLTDVPAWDVPRLLEDERYEVKRLAVPETHLVQFHPKSKPLQSSELRRALMRGSNAADLLRLVMGEGSEDSGRLVTAPYPSTHAGYDAVVRPRSMDLTLSMALVLAARKELGGEIPPLRFVVPTAAPGRDAALALAENWKRVGLEIETIDQNEVTDETEWDLAYRRLTMVDPVRSLGPLITLDSTMEMESLAILPDWLRQRLIDLERASDAASTQAILLDLHRQLAADARCLPLFEVDSVVVSRGPIPGMPERPVTIYQDFERWRLPQDYPDAAP